MLVAPLRSSPCAEEASTSFQSWLFGCGSRARTFVLNAMGSAQPREGTLGVAYNWTFKRD